MASSRFGMVFRRYLSSQPQLTDKYTVIKETITKYDSHEYTLMMNWSKILTLFILPAIGLTFVNCFYINPESHEGPPFKPYPYLRRRLRVFPWRDGVKNLIYNPLTNPGPDGYEEVDH